MYTYIPFLKQKGPATFCATVPCISYGFDPVYIAFALLAAKQWSWLSTPVCRNLEEGQGCALHVAASALAHIWSHEFSLLAWQKSARPDTLPDADHSFDSKSRLVLADLHSSAQKPMVHSGWSFDSFDGCLMLFSHVFPGESWYIKILCWRS